MYLEHTKTLCPLRFLKSRVIWPLHLEPHHDEISRCGPLLLFGEIGLPCLILSNLSSSMHYEMVYRFIRSVGVTLPDAIGPSWWAWWRSFCPQVLHFNASNSSCYMLTFLLCFLPRHASCVSGRARAVPVICWILKTHIITIHQEVDNLLVLHWPPMFTNPLAVSSITHRCNLHHSLRETHRHPKRNAEQSHTHRSISRVLHRPPLQPPLLIAQTASVSSTNAKQSHHSTFNKRWSIRWQRQRGHRLWERVCEDGDDEGGG